MVQIFLRFAFVAWLVLLVGVPLLAWRGNRWACGLLGHIVPHGKLWPAKCPRCGGIR